MQRVAYGSARIPRRCDESVRDRSGAHIHIGSTYAYTRAYVNPPQ